MKSVLKKTAVVITATMLALVAVLAIAFALSNQGGTNNGGVRLGTETPPQVSLPQTPEIEDMLESALKSVVGISSADGAAGINIQNEWYMGSGVIASSDGYIITNHHVVGARPQRIVVTLYNGKTMEGKTVWSDNSLDLAIVKIDGNGYPVSELGDAKKLRVGESVAAIGNPLSMQFERTVTAGIVSAVGRSISIEDGNRQTYMEDLIQTDASINPGNSGGPLLNSKGEVIGINTIKVSSAEGMGFAVPVNVCVPILERLRSVGEFRTPYLGLYAYTPAAARYFNQNVVFENGLYVSGLDEAGPAFAAGIRFGDVVVGIGGEDVNTMLELREQLYERQSGETIELEFIRDGSRRRMRIMLDDKP